MTAISSKEQSSSANDVGLFKDFSQKTTLHGIQYLGEDHLSWVKKAFWLLLIIGFSIMTFIQTKEKFEEYESNPIITNIDVTYFDSLAFPAIAICNINMFRISYTSENIYSTLQDVYSGTRPKPIKNDTNLTLGNAEGLNADQFLKNAAHMIERMVLQCIKPSGALCTWKDFTLLTTDYGICYAINTNIDAPWVANSTGNSYGFSLILNAETYENTNNPSKTAGFKVLIFNQTTKAMVGYNALDLSPGFMTQIGLVKQQNDKLGEEDGGTCVTNMAQENYPGFMYSGESCRLNGMIKYIQEICGCRPFFAPVLNPEPKPRCTIEQHVMCVVDKMTAPSNAASFCKENCTAISFKTTVSFSRLISAELRAIAKDALDGIRDSYEAAMEASSRVDPATVKLLNELFANLVEANEILLENNLQPYYGFFLRSYDRLRLSVPCFSALVGNYPETLPAMTDGEPSTIITGDPSVTDLYLYYVPQFQYLWGNSCSPEQLDSMKNSTELTSFSENVTSVARTLIMLAKVFTPPNFVDQVTEEVARKYTAIFDMMIQYSNGNITRKEFSEQFELQLGDFWISYFEPKFLEPIANSLMVKTSQTIQQLSMFMKDASFTAQSTDLIYGVQAATVGGKGPCKPPQLPGSQGPQGSKESQQQGSSDSNRCAERACDGTLATRAAATIGTENFTRFVQDLLTCADITRDAAQKVDQQIDSLVNGLNVALQKVLADASDYVDTFNLDKTNFYQDNLAGVNIFFNELSVETWSQAKNYDIWSLACDVGGTMGLFLGASLMTMFEFVDLLIALCCRCKRRSPSRKISTMDSKKEFHNDQSKAIETVSTPVPMPFPR